MMLARSTCIVSTYISAMKAVNITRNLRPFMSSFASPNIDVVKVGNIEKGKLNR